MFDGACLVNLLHDLTSRPTMDDLGELFQTYFERRYPAARIAIEGSSQFSRLFHDQVNVKFRLLDIKDCERGGGDFFLKKMSRSSSRTPTREREGFY